jgi:RNA polymerase sigma-70 factor (ECF subfamily)
VNQQSTAFTQFYESARDDCLRVVLASVGDRHQAEDLVAEAFARAWARWRTVSRHPAPQAWVIRTALNARVSWWRLHRREVIRPGWSELGPAPRRPDRILAGIARTPPARPGADPVEHWLPARR